MKTKMSEESLYDSLEDNVSSTSDKDEPQVVNKYHPKVRLEKHEPIQSSKSNMTEPLCIGSRTAVHKPQESNEMKVNNKKVRPSLIPTLSGKSSSSNLSNVCLRKMKEKEVRSVVGRWLHNARNMECDAIMKEELMTRPHQIRPIPEKTSGVYMDTISHSFSSLRCTDEVKSHLSLTSDSFCSRVTSNKLSIHSHRSSNINSSEKCKRTDGKERRNNSVLRNKSYLERFYEKQYGPENLMQRQSPDGSSVCSTLGDTSAQSIGSVSTNCHSVGTSDNDEEDYYRDLIEKDIKRQNYQKTKVTRDSDDVITGSDCFTLYGSLNEVQKCVSGNNKTKLNDKRIKNTLNTVQCTKQDPVGSNIKTQTTYVPYGYTDYQCLPKITLGGLGPDLLSSKHKVLRMRKQREYGESASLRNRQLFALREKYKQVVCAAPLPCPPLQPLPDLKVPPKPTPVQANEEKTKERQARVRARHAARKQASDRAKTRKTKDEEMQSNQILLNELQERHLREVEMAEAIRRTLK